MRIKVPAADVKSGLTHVALIQGLTHLTQHPEWISLPPLCDLRTEEAAVLLERIAELKEFLSSVPISRKRQKR